MSHLDYLSQEIWLFKDQNIITSLNFDKNVENYFFIDRLSSAPYSLGRVSQPCNLWICAQHTCSRDVSKRIDLTPRSPFLSACRMHCPLSNPCRSLAAHSYFLFTVMPVSLLYFCFFVDTGDPPDRCCLHHHKSLWICLLWGLWHWL